jgi:histone H3/H4
MQREKAENQAGGMSRISPSALTEVENALCDYEEEVWNAGRERDGIKGPTIKTYTQGPQKFVAWLKYDFAPGSSPSGPTLPRQRFDPLKLERVAAKKSRISLPALAEVEAVFEEFIREVLRARMGERATNQLGDHADYFIRWLKYEFAPGARKNWRGEAKSKSFGPSSSS